MRLVGAGILVLALLAGAMPTPTAAACGVDLSHMTSPRVSAKCVTKELDLEAGAESGELLYHGTRGHLCAEENPEKDREVVCELAFQSRLEAGIYVAEEDPLRLAMNTTYELPPTTLPSGEDCGYDISASTSDVAVARCDQAIT